MTRAYRCDRTNRETREGIEVDASGRTDGRTVSQADEPARSPRLLVIQPDPNVPIGQFGPWLEESGVAIEVVRPFDGDHVPSQLDEDGLIVLGGDMSSLDDAEYSWLEDIRSLVRSVASDGRPALGICLGGQLMAQALGGETAVGDHGLETGVASVRWRPGAADDPIFRDLPNPFAVGTMHRDAITVLPPGAVWLGESTPYPNQAFRVADNVWGIQFHPEANHRQYESWASLFGGPSNPAWEQIQEGARAFERAEASIARHCKLIALRFADLVRVATGATSHA